MGRPTVTESKRVRNAGFTAHPGEITAIGAAAKELNFKKPFDFIRRLIIDRDHPRTRGKIASPRLRSPSKN